MSGRRQLKNQISDLLTGLGDSSDEVAATLHRAGVRAVPRSPERCAVSRYLSAVLGADSRVQSFSVGTSCMKASSMKSTPFYFYGTLLITVPRPVGQFVASFDNGRYPELIEGERSSPDRVTHASEQGAHRS